MDPLLLVLKKTMFLWILKRFLKVIVKVFKGTSMKKIQRLLPAVNV